MATPWLIRSRRGGCSGATFDSSALHHIFIPGSQSPPNPRHHKSIRPGHLFECMNCTDLLFQDVTFRDSPFWTVHPVFSRRVVARRLTILNDHHSPNTGAWAAPTQVGHWPAVGPPPVWAGAPCSEFGRVTG